jgi:hypothetical protein
VKSAPPAPAAELTARPAFVVRIAGRTEEERERLRTALLEVPIASDEDLARLDVIDDDAPCDAVVLLAERAPDDTAAEQIATLAPNGRPLFVAAVCPKPADGNEAEESALREAWAKVVDSGRVHLVSIGEGEAARGIDELRAALLDVAIAGAHLPVERIRRAKRPYALGIISGAALVSAGEGLLPGAGALVIATQASAVSSLVYLYTGRWLGRSQALAILPAFAAEAAGGSVFLLIKSFFPPTGVADVLAAAVAVSMTVAILGTIAWALDQGYSLEEKDQLKRTFKKLRARTRAERKAIAENRDRWGDRKFWRDLVERIVFPRS